MNKRYKSKYLQKHTNLEDIVKHIVYIKNNKMKSKSSNIGYYNYKLVSFDNYLDLGWKSNRIVMRFAISYDKKYPFRNMKLYKLQYVADALETVVDALKRDNYYYKKDIDKDIELNLSDNKLKSIDEKYTANDLIISGYYESEEIYSRFKRISMIIPQTDIYSTIIISELSNEIVEISVDIGRLSENIFRNIKEVTKNKKKLLNNIIKKYTKEE